jgi:kynurenine formamidase
VEGGKRVEEFGLERFISDAGLLDLTNMRPGQAIDDEDLEAAEEAAGLALRAGEAVILVTCADDVSHVERSNVYLSQNGADYLEFKGVSMVGTDSVSLDNSESSELSAHRTLLGKDILVLEGLCGLGALEASRFRLVCFPLKLSGPIAPVRAVALLD